MTLDASGNLGVGTTSPDARLDVTRSGNGQIAVLQTGTNRGFSFESQSDTALQIASIQGSTNLDLWANTLSFSAGGSERARIDSSGYFYVRTTASQGVSTFGGVVGLYSIATYTPSNAGTYYHASFTEAGTQRGSISSNGTLTTYSTTSDYRLKNNPQPLTNSGAFIDALKPKSWDWENGDGKGIGFIAHEFAEVSPSSVVGKKDDVDANGKPIYQSMQASSAEVIANLVAEIQSLRQRLSAANL
jgi:hypothetical protein